MQRALWSDQPARVVMIIDDSIITLKILEVSLQRNDISWVSFSNGPAALQALKQQTNLIPAVVLLDIKLPDMDGFAVARLLRSNSLFDQTAILMLTGYDSILNRLRARLAGVDYFLTKPFKTTEVLAAVSRYVRVANTLPESTQRAWRGGYHACPIDARATDRSDCERHAYNPGR